MLLVGCKAVGLDDRPFQQNYSVREIGLGCVCLYCYFMDKLKNNVAADRKRGDLVNEVKGN